MCELLKLFFKKDIFFETLRKSLRDAQENAENETNAAIFIQRCFRGKLARDKIRFKSNAANEIQRVFRGHVGRKKYRSIKKQRNENIRFAIINFFVLQLQRLFRGYYSRKYRQNYSRRKNFIKSLEDRGNQVREMQSKYAIEQAKREEQEAIDKKNSTFYELSKNMHHLVSTKTSRGVLNPNPYFIETPTMNGVPVEEHVRGVVKDLLRSRGITKTGMIPDHNGMKKVPLKGLQSKLSIQASTPYFVAEEERKKEKAVSKLLTSLVHNPNKKDPFSTSSSLKFTAGGRIRPGDRNSETVPLCLGDPYLDAWANPMLKRGIPQTQDQLLLSCTTRKAMFLKPLEGSQQALHPFVTRTGGNKSSALPNDLFDVILDAEVTGGAVHRNLGTSVRFGVPDNSDFRPTDGPVPCPPLRASTVRPSRPSRIKKYTLPVRSMGGGTLLQTGLEGNGSIDSTASSLLYEGNEDLILQPENKHKLSADDDDDNFSIN